MDGCQASDSDLVSGRWSGTVYYKVAGYCGGGWCGDLWE